MNTVQSGGQGVSTAKKDPGLEVRKITVIRIVVINTESLNSEFIPYIWTALARNMSYIYRQRIVCMLSVSYKITFFPHSVQ